jgi:hypothetical protein
MKLLFIQFPPASYYFIPIGSKYTPQHPVLKHSQCMFIPLTPETKFHTLHPTKNYRQNYRLVYSSFYVFRQQAI